ncbi:CBS domain-containing protein [Leptodesmis sichuanensis]|uniref:CBS domain-containing protein n=1 Tax=Leptodesmis sichuanensis TaxID=2906798 RepID=UPI0025B72423|nr:CBS domain-containing protein [Leptodesmis sichuanensis A121]
MHSNQNASASQSRLREQANSQQEYVAWLRSQLQMLLEQSKLDEAKALLVPVHPADIADAIDRQLFQHLTPEERDATALLLGFQPNTAGRLMTPEYLSLKEDQTVQQALDRIRRFANQVETISYLYVTDRDCRLTGTLSLRELVVAQPDQPISSIMTRDVLFVHTDTDQEEAARLIQQYDFVALPVVDREQRLVGILC